MTMIAPPRTAGRVRRTSHPLPTRPRYIRCDNRPHPSEAANEWLPPASRYPHSVAALPDHQQWALQLARGIVEVLAGLRPSVHLQRWVAPPVYAHLRKVAPADTDGPPLPPVQVSRIKSCSISDNIHEVAVVLIYPTQTRVVGLRLERLPDRWLTTAVDIV